MAYSGILVSAGTATTNPAPSSLGTPNPYPTPYVDRRTVSTAWATQSLTFSPALFPAGALNGAGQVPIPLKFVPSVAGATYTVSILTFDNVSKVWAPPKDNASFTMTGNDTTQIDNPGYDPIYLQLSNISSGTVAIYFDNGLARAQ